MENRKVRAIVSTKVGCHERTDWFPEESMEAVEAVNDLVHRQTEMVCIDWEKSQEADQRDPGSGGERVYRRARLKRCWKSWESRARRQAR